MTVRLAYTDLGVYISTDSTKKFDVEGMVLPDNMHAVQLANQVPRWPVNAQIEDGLYYMNYTRFNNFLDI